MFARARSTSASVSVSVPKYAKRYATKPKTSAYDLRALAAKIESVPPSRTPAKSQRSPSRPPGWEASQAFRTPIRSSRKPPQDFVPFGQGRPYNPYDFLPSNRLPPTYRKLRPTEGPSKPLAIREDPFYQLGIDPLDETLNCGLLSSYTTKMGRIQSRGETRLTWKSQRKIGKAIRRARAMGLIPAFSQWEESMIKSI